MASRSGKKRRLDPIYTAEELRAFRRGKYLVKWQGYDEGKSTWEPPRHILDKGLIASFNEVKNWAWEYEVEAPVDGKQPGWHEFDATTIGTIEKAFGEWVSMTQGGATPAFVLYQTSKALPTGKIGVFDYRLDFLPHLVQVNMKTGTKRVVRRVPAASNLPAPASSQPQLQQQQQQQPALHAVVATAVAAAAAAAPPSSPRPPPSPQIVDPVV